MDAWNMKLQYANEKKNGHHNLLKLLWYNEES